MTTGGVERLDQVLVVPLSPTAQPSQHNPLLVVAICSRRHAAFVLASSVTPQPAIAIEISLFVTDI
jgi:hypothetical protein